MSLGARVSLGLGLLSQLKSPLCKKCIRDEAYMGRSVDPLYTATQQRGNFNLRTMERLFSMQLYSVEPVR